MMPSLQRSACHARWFRLKQSDTVRFLQIRAIRQSGLAELGLSKPGLVVTSGVTCSDPPCMSTPVVAFREPGGQCRHVAASGDRVPGLVAEFRKAGSPL